MINTAQNFDPIQNAQPVKSELLPLTRPLPNELPFPKDALLSLKGAVEAIHYSVGAPYAMCANSVLAAVTLAVQAHRNVQMPVGSPKPISEFFLTIGGTGERKSACDDMALKAIYDYEKELKESYEIKRRSWLNDKETWDAARRKILGNKNTNRGQQRADLEKLGAEPQEPTRPIITFPEPTYQGLVKYLDKGHPSVGLFSTEGGQFVGGHAMKEDNRLETAAGFNSLWDGTPLKRIRSGDGSTFMPGKRVSLHIMMQPDVGVKILTDKMLEDTGFLGRTLMCYPVSTQGTRFFRETTSSVENALSSYNQKLATILRTPLPLSDTENELIPEIITLSEEAKKTWIAFNNETEKNRGANGYFSTIAGLANKLPEHATRIANVLALYENIGAYEITNIHMEAGIELAQYYAQEALRLKEINATDSNLLLAERLLSWIKEKNYKFIPLADVYQKAPVRALRSAKDSRNIMAILTDHGHIEPVPDGMEIEGVFKKEVWRICV